MPENQALAETTANVLEWAASHISFDHSELIKNEPWVKEYQLKNPDRCVYLRHTPPRLRGSLNVIPAIATHFPEHVPQVIAQEDSLGVQLLEKNQGEAIEYENDKAARLLLSSYAAMQAKASELPDLLSSLPALQSQTTLVDLLRFLDPTTVQNIEAEVGSARYYLGRGTSTGYFQALSKCESLLKPLLYKASRLPSTLNHGNLLPEIASHTEAGEIALDSWDHAVAGPAGLSIHALHGGCAVPVVLLYTGSAINDDADVERMLMLLETYANALVDSGYAPRAEVVAGLPGAICAGAIHSMLWHADQPHKSSSYRHFVRGYIQSRLSDLLDLCDHLALQDKQTVLSFARDYSKNDRRWRAERLLLRYVEKDAQCATAFTLLAHVLQHRGKIEQATEACRKAIELEPLDAGLREQLGEVLLEDADWEDAERNFRRALAMDASLVSSKHHIRRCLALQNCEQEAGDDLKVPAVTLSKEEIENGKWSGPNLALGAKLFLEYGVLQINNAFNDDLIEACNTAFIRKYSRYFAERTRGDALRIGDKRYQISVALQGVLNDPKLYANSFILPVMRKLLGEEFNLGCTVCATSLPGAKDQHVHKDHRSLFAKDADETPIAMPPFAITTMVPLVDIDENIGTTCVRKGSHRLSRRDSDNLPEQRPIVAVGSCFLMDMRLSHNGLANRTDKVRPILNMVYQRYWFADTKNFASHPPLQIPAEEYQRIPEMHKKLFAWADQPGPQINF